MKKLGIALVIVVVLLALVAGTVISRYNQLVELENNVDVRWAQVENQLQRRADLIPNLVSTVQGYASHETEIFTEVANARSRLLGAGSPEEQIAANDGLDHALGRLLAISEAYPELKADTSFLRLQDELAGTENRIAVERMRYNESVELWNRTIRQFPMVMLATVMGADAKTYFEAAPGAAEVPQVQF